MSSESHVDMQAPNCNERVSTFETVPLDVALAERSKSLDEAIATGMSLLLLPTFASNEECDKLVASASCWEAQASIAPQVEGRNTAAAEYGGGGTATKKLCVTDKLDSEAQELTEILLRRLLLFLEGDFPHFSSLVFGASHGLCKRARTYSPNEPAVNIYTEGGHITAHEDGKQLTLLIALSHPDDDFEGGGTAFWHGRSVSYFAKFHEPTLTLRPPRGTAMLWTGQVTHAGVPVTAGKRHAFVASFSLGKE